MSQESVKFKYHQRVYVSKGHFAGEYGEVRGVAISTDGRDKEEIIYTLLLEDGEYTHAFVDEEDLEEA